MPGELIHRKALLEQILKPSAHVRFSPHTVGDGRALYQEATRKGFEGIVAKHQASPYIQKRSDHWLKIKVVKHQDVVIAGYTQPQGNRQHFGALVMGVYKEGKLDYAGHVGGGFSQDQLRSLHGRLQRLRVRSSPFDSSPPIPESVQWVKPVLVCQVKFAEWTKDMRLRQPIFLGMRDDKEPDQCTPESPQPTSKQVEAVETGLPLRSGQSFASASAVKVATHKRWSSGSGEAAVRRKTPAVHQTLPSGQLTGNLTLAIGKDRVELTNLDKSLWPHEGITKGQLIQYYFNVSSALIPYLRHRPLILQRYPEGINKGSFYQHDIDDVPSFVKVFSTRAEDGHRIDYAVCNNLATLLYLVNLGTIAQNPWNSRVQNPDRPDWLVFDLDSTEQTLSRACEVALRLRKFLQELRLESYAKTSGSAGLHVYVPIRPVYTFERVAALARWIALRTASADPRRATVQRRVRSRPAGRVYLDYLQNAHGKSVVAPYSVRAKAGATVSTPLTWTEVERCPAVEDFTIGNVVERLERRGDPFKAVLTTKQSLKYALEQTGVD
jgi:bifunctional non-homologous end joining protein LigD